MGGIFFTNNRHLHRTGWGGLSGKHFQEDCLLHPPTVDRVVSVCPECPGKTGSPKIFQNMRPRASPPWGQGPGLLNGLSLAYITISPFPLSFMVHLSILKCWKGMFFDLETGQSSVGSSVLSEMLLFRALLSFTAFLKFAPIKMHHKLWEALILELTHQGCLLKTTDG